MDISIRIRIRIRIRINSLYVYDVTKLVNSIVYYSIL